MLGKLKINTLRLDLFFCALGKFGQGILWNGTVITGRRSSKNTMSANKAG